MTQPVVDRGDFRWIDDFAAPWPAFVTCARADVLARHGRAVERLITLVAEEAGEFAASPDAPAEIAREYGLGEQAARNWLERTRWSTGLRTPDGALQSAREVLVQAGAIEG